MWNRLMPVQVFITSILHQRDYLEYTHILESENTESIWWLT